MLADSPEPDGGRSAGVGAIYCRIPHRHDAGQNPVDCQERACRTAAGEIGVLIDQRQVYVDNLAASWLRDRPRPAWDAMLSAAKGGVFTHLFCDGLELLLKQPWDVAELLQVAEDHGITLHGSPGGRDFGNAGERRKLRDEADRACRAATKTSLAARSAHAQAVSAGRPHGGGRRAYGYQAGTYDLVADEVAIVREVFRRYQDGESLRAIAWGLNDRGVLTAGGLQWTVTGVGRLLDAPRYAGLLVHRGEIARAEDGSYLAAAWQPCVSIETWERTRALRRTRELERQADRRPARDYPLTGLLRCTKCGRRLVGEAIAGYPTYACTSKSLLSQGRCRRHIAAEPLEAFVEEAAMAVLEDWDAEAAGRIPVAIHPDGRREQAEPHLPDLPDPRQLEELDALRSAGAISEEEYASVRAVALSRARAVQRAVVVRPVGALDGVVTGARARFSWNRLPAERRKAVLRVLFAGIWIGPSSTAQSVFDHGRIHVLHHRGAAEATDG
ncbi:site-specific DNA recombinase [Streptacidiphilus sp. MAP12-16]|uniref:recombinase family protein n=1 Tax=Streptacidiphilus sp. MAP12-16 TaxID=3156300 RepID=UPI003513EDD5